MAPKPLIFHPDAEREYLTSLEWYRQRSPTAALNEFSRTISKIEEAPDRWPVHFKTCRRFVLHQFPFSIVYTNSPARFIVLAVAHAYRRPGYWRKRLQWKGPDSEFEQ